MLMPACSLTCLDSVERRVCALVKDACVCSRACAPVCALALLRAWCLSVDTVQRAGIHNPYTGDFGPFIKL
jgi:hypothetical protein